MGANPWASLVVDDIVSTEPWQVRMLEIRGQAERLKQGRTKLGPRFADEMFRIHPHRIQSVGLDGDPPTQDVKARPVIGGGGISPLPRPPR